MTTRWDWKRDRWFGLALAFLVVNAWAVWRWDVTRDVQGQTRVAAFQAGRDGEVAAAAPLRWIFTRDVVDRDTVGVWSPVGPVTLEPTQSGRYAWVTPRELEFQPSHPWQTCTRFTAALDPSFRAADGRPLPAHTAVFRTPALRVAACSVVGRAHDGGLTLRLAFTAPPDTEKLASAIAATTGDASAPATDLVVRIGAINEATVLLSIARPTTRSPVVLRIAKGLPPQAGDRALEEAYTATFNPSDDLRVESVEPSLLNLEGGRIAVRFNGDVDVAGARPFLTLEPDTPFQLLRLDDWRGVGLQLVGKLEAGKRYTLRLHAGLPGTSGQSLPTATSHTVQMADFSPTLTFPLAGNQLAPGGPMRIPLRWVNTPKISLTVEEVYPNNLVPYARRCAGHSPYYVSRWSAPQVGDLSRVVARETYAPTGPFNQPGTLDIDLRALLGGPRTGTFLLTASGAGGEGVEHLVIVSDLTLATRLGTGELLVWVNGARDASAAADVLVRVYSAANQAIAEGRTDADGLLRLRGDFTGPERTPYLVTAQRDEDLTYLALDPANARNTATATGVVLPPDGLRAHVHMARGVFRPGETAQVAAIVRDRHLRAPGRFPVEFRVSAPDGRVVRSLPALLDDLGRAEVDIPWPLAQRTGRYRIGLHLPGELRPLGETEAAVEDFVPPQVAVSIGDLPPRTGGAFGFRVAARHLHGAPAAGLAVAGSVYWRTEPFAPTNWPGYAFGDAERPMPARGRPLGDHTLDAEGRAWFAVEAPQDWRPPAALRAIVGATVTEESGRPIAAFASTTLDVYPRYIGLAPTWAAGSLRAGQSHSFAVAVVRPDGSADVAATSVQAALVQRTWQTALRQQPDGAWTYETAQQDTPVRSWTVPLQHGRADGALELPVGGQYALVLTDADGGAATRLLLHAAGADDRWVTEARERPMALEIVPDREAAPAGETIGLRIRSPFAGRGLLTVESEGLLDTRVFSVEAGDTVLPVLLQDAWYPNVHCSVTLVRGVAAADGPALAAAGGTVLRVTRPAARLALRLEAPARMEPLTPLVARVRVSDASGAPVAGANVTFMAVDEGILRLTDFRTPDPLADFETTIRSGVAAHDVFRRLVAESDLVREGQRSHTGGDAASALRGRINPVDARRFVPVSLWKSGLRTDADGMVEATFDVPEFTGALRVMAVATAPAAFGSAFVAVTVKRDLTVLPDLPRFLAPGDVCTFRVRLRNDSPDAQTVRLRVHTQGPLHCAENQSALTLAAGAESAWETRLTAAASPGVGRIRVEAEAATLRYAEDIELPVRPAAPRTQHMEAFHLAAGETRVLHVPTDYLTGTVAAEIWCAAQPTLVLAGGIDHLLRYPYGCVEQTVSSAFPLLVLSDLAEALHAGDASRFDARRHIDSGILRVLSMQRPDGGFGYWPGDRSQASDWVSAYATHFLVEAQRAGHTPPADGLAAALRRLEQRLDAGLGSGDTVTAAYATYVLARADRRADRWLARLWELRRDLPAPARLYLACALAAADRRADAVSLLERFGGGTPADIGPKPDETHATETRNLAVLLWGWLDADPDHPHVDTLVRSLSESLQLGRWYTTQDNAAALLALGRHARAFPRPDQPARVTVTHGNAPARTVETFDPVRTTVAAEPGGAVTLANVGAGRATVWWNASGIPATQVPPPVDRGLRIRRTVLDRHGQALDSRAPLAGELLVIRLDLANEGPPRTHVVLEALLPAGLEPEARTTEAHAILPWLGTPAGVAPAHVERRDDRVLAFFDRVDRDIAWHYVVRAVTPGTFLHPPPAAACLYDPMVHSIHASSVLTIQPRNAAATIGATH